MFLIILHSNSFIDSYSKVRDKILRYKDVVEFRDEDKAGVIYLLVNGYVT